ncbi:DUF885 family protein [candidate division KSB1 bacterium]|nr:DUF885 family protein [candidate division KSB1 bacterium]
MAEFFWPLLFCCKHRIQSLIIAVVIIFCILGFSCLKNPEQERFKLFQMDYLAYYQTHHLIYQIQNRLDDDLPDVSQLTFQDQIQKLEAYQDHLASFDTSKFNENSQLEYVLLNRHLQYEVFNLKDRQISQRNIYFYGELLGNALYWPLKTASLPPEKQLGLFLKRLNQLPRFIQQIKDNVIAPNSVQVEMALDLNAGLIDFLKKEPVEIAKNTAAFTDSVNRAVKFAIFQLEDWNRYLQNNMLPHVSIQFRLGENSFNNLLNILFEAELTPEKLLSLTEKELGEIQNNLLAIASEIHQKFYNRRVYSPEVANSETKKLTDAINYIKNERTDIEKELTAVHPLFKESERFVDLKNLLNLPSDRIELKYEPLPFFLDGSEFCASLLRYFEKPVYYFYLNPGNRRWSWPEVLGFTKNYNQSMMKVLILSHLMPGRYLQTVFADSVESLAQKYWGDLAIREGWPLFAPFFMAKQGFTGYEPRFLLAQNIALLQAILETQLCIQVHTQDLEKNVALKTLKETGFYEDVLLEGRWRQICLQPELIIARFWGFYQLRELSNLVRTQKMNQFYFNQFNNKVLRSGLFPVNTIQKCLLRRD